MSGLFDQPDGATPLTPEEMRDLIPTHISFRSELNSAEQANILRAQNWALARRRDLLEVKFIQELHRRMFSDVWRWAGRFRTSPRNIGIDHWLISVELRRLLDDARAWLELESYSADELALRFHHRLVFIHPFPNGNGRHARLMADLLILRQGQPRFTWGSASLHQPGLARKQYLDALRAADRHDIAPLLAFSRA